jgi:hypothetical protein
MLGDDIDLIGIITRGREEFQEGKRVKIGSPQQYILA